MWFSSACTNMGQKADSAVLFVIQFGHENAPSHGNLRALYHGERILSKSFHQTRRVIPSERSESRDLRTDLT